MPLCEFTDQDRALFREMRVLVLCPIMHSEVLFWRSLANMIAFSWDQGLRVEQLAITNRVVVDWARNDLARTALEGNSYFTDQPFTHFLWLDSDHTFNPDLACRLASHNVDMASALYFGRTNYLPVVYVKDQNDPDEYKHFPLIEYPAMLFEADAVGFGACLTRREVFERVPEPWFTLDWRAGEDIAFCTKARQHGVKIHVDGQYKLGHIGEPPIIGEQDYLKHLEDNADKYKDKVRVSLEDR